LISKSGINAEKKGGKENMRNVIIVLENGRNVEKGKKKRWKHNWKNKKEE